MQFLSMHIYLRRVLLLTKNLHILSRRFQRRLLPTLGWGTDETDWNDSWDSGGVACLLLWQHVDFI